MKFERATLPAILTNPSAFAEKFNMTLDQAVIHCAKAQGDTVWLSDTHQVNVHEEGIFWHLSIKRIDKEPEHDWRILQDIKTSICGPEAEGVELYPAESRLVDMANQYHLWVLKEGQFPFGFDSGRMVSGAASASAIGAKQRDR